MSVRHPDAARPDPDALLEHAREEERKRVRGRLEIFFGAAAGVGKTYAMLAAAHRQRGRGVDVAVGIVETHRRAETAALLEGLERLPLRELGAQGLNYAEFDLDAALARRPALLLVDELAHSNAPGSRHPKRYQDVEELLAAGIDVYTTVNVQHVESLNDVVGGITGIRVRETVPDRVFDAADEIVLVDLPPDELLERLAAGKVYLPEQAARAGENFFRKGNLVALRELALRRTADRVDEDVRAWRRSLPQQQVWATREALLACIGPGPGGERVARGAGRLAQQLDVRWHAVYAETARLQHLPEAQRRRILDSLALAQDLGAMTATLPAQDAAAAVAEYARKHNLTKIALGRDTAAWRWPWQVPFRNRLRRLAPDTDLVLLADDRTPLAPLRQTAPADDDEEDGRSRWSRCAPYVATLAITALTALVASPLIDLLALTNIAMLFLLAVVVVAVRYGRRPAALAACANVLVFDYFFVPPRYTLAVSDIEYLLTFAVLLLVGLVIGQLAAGLRYQAQVAAHREGRARDLYEMARELSAALIEAQIVELGQRFVRLSFRARAHVLLVDAESRVLSRGPADDAGAPLDLGLAQWVFDREEAAGIGTDTLPASAALYLPLKAAMRVRGVLVVEPERSRWLLVPEQRRQLEIFATLIAIALERVHFVSVAQDALLRIESERLRNALLSALSHELRTPLTALVGLADTLQAALAGAAEARATTQAIRDEALRMSALVDKLLEMARLQSGAVQLSREWQSLEEVAGSAIHAARRPLGSRRVEVELPADLPLIEFDATLIERVLVNLLENAGKYTPDGSTVRLSAALDPTQVVIRVVDQGPGLIPGQEEAVFEKFTRGDTETTTPGVGLGLAICRAIVEAHGGRIWADNRAGGGAVFTFTLPLGEPPAVPAEPVAAA